MLARLTAERPALSSRQRAQPPVEAVHILRRDAGEFSVRPEMLGRSLQPVPHLREVTRCDLLQALLLPKEVLHERPEPVRHSRLRWRGADLRRAMTLGENAACF